MATPLITKRRERYTWSDYLTWPDEERWEIIGGVPYAMSPAPSTRHQSVVVNLLAKLSQQLAGNRCRPFIAPTDVRLSETDVVQPDILIVCDPVRVLASHIEGAPDVGIEVLSPTTSTKDLREKKALYERSGIREYVVVDPLEQYALRFVHDEARYDSGTVFGPNEKLALATLEGIEVALWEVFELPAPPPPEPSPE